MQTVNEYFTKDSARDTFGHWTLLGDYEAEAFVNWLMNDSGLSKYEIIDELEYQINKPDAGFLTVQECSKALDAIPVSCAMCNKTIPFREANAFNKYKTESHSDVVSRSMVGGTIFRRKTSITYIAERNYICNDCLVEYKRKRQEVAKKDKGIRHFFKNLFG
ncbi:hypothetical protein [Prevotella sp. RM4]|uniref:hypothetical protein n=1 Tax=Prevotella sp. RM4 TaxID=1200547 RepID=UPI00051B0E72|nr:hypothetical protein [Prevotella sp. RM4]